MEILTQLLLNLTDMDEYLVKEDVNTALRKVHESMTLIREYRAKEENEKE